MKIDLKHSPCEKCKERTMTCHSTCKDYKEWREAYSARNAELLIKNIQAAEIRRDVKIRIDGCKKKSFNSKAVIKSPKK